MSKKFAALIVGVVASLAVMAGTMQGCSDSSSGTNGVALCEMICDKVLSCTPDAGSEGQQALMLCKQNCASQVPTTTCTNQSAIASAIQACLPMACGAYLECLTGVPACQGTGGTGGTTGTGGAGGAPAGDCSVCTKADQCCTALDPNADCMLASNCTAATGQTQVSVINVCQGVLNAVAGQPTAPAACK